MSVQSLSRDPLACQSLGEIAARLPGATKLFHAHKLDFCCGGAQRLDEAAAERGLPLDTILSELHALDQETPEAVPHEPGALIGHILARFHETHRAELPELIRLAKKVEAVHRNHPAVPRGITESLSVMQDELEMHMQKEEQILFPMMKAGGNPMIIHPIGCMREEHDAHAERIHALETLTRDFTPPEDACATWRALYKGAAKLIGDLMEHIHLENNVLFRQFEPKQS